MQKIALTVLLGLGLSSCTSAKQRVDWESDCETYYSYDSRELDICKKKVAAGLDSDNTPGKVFLDPDNTTRPDGEDLVKHRNSAE